jgi:hypothetical protein
MRDERRLEGAFVRIVKTHIVTKRIGKKEVAPRIGSRNEPG